MRQPRGPSVTVACTAKVDSACTWSGNRLAATAGEDNCPKCGSPVKIVPRRRHKGWAV